MQSDPTKIKSYIRSALEDEALRQAVKKATDHSLTKRAEVVAELPHWENLRDRAAHIRNCAITGLEEHLLMLEERASAKGIEVHWAKDAAEAKRIVGDICTAATRVSGSSERPIIAKSKSMTTEEIGLTPYLEGQGFEVVETDLGEYIVQIAGQMPSHITAPALHLSRSDVGRLFADKLGVEYEDDPVKLIGIARKVLREKFMKAEIGITGVNFAVAESGTPVMVENEGNGRLVGAIPRVQISVMGIEKVIPTFEDLMVLLELLPRSATGQRITGSVLFFNRPRKEGETDGPEQMHLVIVDNGRTKALADPDLREVLRCIRCGACLNTCPVYRQTGGHAYGWIYPGPIGAVLAPIFLGLDKAGDHPFASSLCGSCSEICPVKIDLHRLLLNLRSRVTSEIAGWSGERAVISGWQSVMSRPDLYRALAGLPRFILHDILQGRWSPPLPIWGKSRSSPPLARSSFSEMFLKEFTNQEKPEG
ncbi:iron-sulfur cluster-binding protein [candidate division LCP-89 bacterium B3_LCP]|uniref:Iron-sulfur cluster-binding protein n=1 Tax=candidate division LCP-89 bacterium B3_LCP TaxID=2012998 RepID=A0A532V0G8_UNCL8|nr:MAG: iron-sulfur cluster-binding protein [candidate division LCP-89 bacterium B3_LCP]